MARQRAEAPSAAAAAPKPEGISQDDKVTPPELAEPTTPADVAAIPVPELPTSGPVEEIAELFANASTDDASPPSLGAPPSQPEAAPTEEPTVRRRRRRRPVSAPVETPDGSAAPTPDELASLSRALGAGFSVAFRFAGAQRGAHWLLTPEEETRMGDAWAEALAPYMRSAAKWVPFAMAGLTTVGVVMPRVDMDRRLAGALPVQPTLAPPSPDAPPQGTTVDAQYTAPAVPSV